MGVRSASGLLALLFASAVPAQEDTTRAREPLHAPLALHGLAASGMPELLGTLDTADAPMLGKGAGVTALAGRMAGVRVHHRDPLPGELPPVSLFGLTKIDRLDRPRYVVDGVPIVGQPTDLWLGELAAIDVIEGQRAATWLGSLGSDGVLHLRSVLVRPNSSRWAGRVNAEAGRASPGARVPLNMRHHYLVGPEGYVDLDGNPVDRAWRTAHPSGMAVFEYPSVWDNQGELFRVAATRAVDATAAGTLAGVLLNAAGSIEHEEGIVYLLRPLRRRNVRGALERDFARGGLRFSANAQQSRSEREPYDLSAATRLVLMTEPDRRLREQNEAGHYLYAPHQGLSLDNMEERERTIAGARMAWTPRHWVTATLAVSHDARSREHGGIVPGYSQFLSPPRFHDGRRQSLRTAAASLSGRRTFGAAEGWATLALLDALQLDSSHSESPGPSIVRAFRMETRTGVLHAGGSIPRGLTLEGSVQHERNGLFPAPDRSTVNWRLGGTWQVIGPRGWTRSDRTRLSFGASHGTRASALIPDEGGFVPVFGPVPQPRAEHTRETILTAEARQGRASLALGQVRATTTHAHYLVAPNSPARDPGATLDRSHALASLGVELLRSPRTRVITRVHLERHRQRVGSTSNPCLFISTGMLCDGASLGTVYGYTWVRSLDEVHSRHPGAVGAFAIDDEGYVVAVGHGGSLATPAWGTWVEIDERLFPWGLPVTRPALSLHASPIMDAAPRAVLGSSSTLRHGPLTVSGVVTGQIGGTVYDRAAQMRYWSRTHPDLDQANRPEQLRKPWYYYERLYTSSAYNDHFVRDAGHAVLEEVAVSYRFARARPGRTAPGVELALAGRNLAHWGSEAGHDAARAGYRPVRDFLAPNPREVRLRVGVAM